MLGPRGSLMLQLPPSFIGRIHWSNSVLLLSGGDRRAAGEETPECRRRLLERERARLSLWHSKPHSVVSIDIFVDSTDRLAE